jgi:hypothetical protein
MPAAPASIASATTRLPRRQTGCTFGWLERRPLTATFCLALAGALLLQLWRPFFFLTCDTLSGTLPVSTEAYRRLWEGRWPFYNEYLFGGFNLLTDTGHFTLWSPLALPFSFLARTPYYFWLPDIVGTLSLVVIAGAFCWSALRLRHNLALPISVPLIIGLSLSYAFTPYNFIVGASWIGFLNVQAAYPLVLAGAFERGGRRALAMQGAALLYAIFGGHMHLFTVLLIFGSLTVLLAAWVRRSGAPLFIWAAAALLTLLLILPLLWPGIVCFNQTTRSAGLQVAEASRNNVPGASLVASFLLGPMAQQLLANGIRIDLSDRLYNLAIAFALVNLPLAGLLAWKRRWTTLETGLLALGLAAAVGVARPYWLAETMARLPVLRSLRWPFREIAGADVLPLRARPASDHLRQSRPLLGPLARRPGKPRLSAVRRAGRAASALAGESRGAIRAPRGLQLCLAFPRAEHLRFLERSTAPCPLARNGTGRQTLVLGRDLRRPADRPHHRRAS